MRQEGSKIFIADLIQTGIIRPVHISRLKKLDPTFEASRQTVKANYCQVERIVSHRFTTQGNLVVQVKWTDYDEPSEEHLRENPSIRRTQAFVTYCTIDHPELRQYAEGIVIFNQ
jgi:hypothetical protein